MHNRRTFFRTGLALGLGAIALTIDPKRLLHSSEPKWVSLPGPHGFFEVDLGENTLSSFIGAAKAQQYDYYQFQRDQYYAGLYRQQQMEYMRRQAAYQAWLAEQAWQQHMRAHMWAREQHRLAMKAYMDRNPGYRYANSAQAWPAVESVYALAMDDSSRPVMFGANSSGDSVAVKDTVKGAAAFFDRVNKQNGFDAAQKSIGPQNNERKAKLVLPDGKEIDGKAYETKAGAIAVSDRDDYKTREGRIGSIVKKVEYNNEEYLVV
jgi:hypothetical protein